MGILALCRPEYFPFGIVLAVILGAWHWRLGIPSGRVVILAIGIVAVMSPWIIRNFNTFGHPFVSTGGLGYSLFLGTFEGSSGFTGWSDVPEEFFPDQHERMMLVAMTEEYMQAMRRGSVDISSVDRKFLDFAVSRLFMTRFHQYFPGSGTLRDFGISGKLQCIAIQSHRVSSRSFYSARL
ncbi:MAG: hypothetical protein IPO66_02790 [Rhodanobacteraceae bacterium]|nr:hypothetical protein [Rhodanobacteraceae bacterium]